MALDIHLDDVRQTDFTLAHQFIRCQRFHLDCLAVGAQRLVFVLEVRHGRAEAVGRDQFACSPGGGHGRLKQAHVGQFVDPHVRGQTANRAGIRLERGHLSPLAHLHRHAHGGNAKMRAEVPTHRAFKSVQLLRPARKSASPPLRQL